VKEKKWLLLLIIAFPSVFWLLLETSTVNSKRLPIYGSRSVAENGDSIFHRVSAAFFDKSGSKQLLDKEKYPLFAVIFVREKYKGEGYRLVGLWEYLNYKPAKIAPIPLILVTENAFGPASQHLDRFSKSENVHFFHWPENSYDSIVKEYFELKPYYIDYSFLVLVDGERRVRGYYDTRFASEVKRLIDEYQHLRLKEEKQKMIRSNEIEQQT
jgi:hypothetical protein